MNKSNKIAIIGAGYIGVELAGMLRARDISATEVCQYFLDRINADSTLNAFITVDAEGALRQARSADQRLREDDPPALCGLPVAHKDIACDIEDLVFGLLAPALAALALGVLAFRVSGHILFLTSLKTIVNE